MNFKLISKALERESVFYMLRVTLFQLSAMANLTEFAIIRSWPRYKQILV